jgi:Ca-activated chloride channel family protein
MLLKRFCFHAFAIALLVLGPGASATCLAAQFDAEIVISGPGADGAYKVNMGDGYYRIQKTRGFAEFPSHPLIVNRDTGSTLWLDPRAKKYAVIKSPAHKAMLNPLAGWEMTRKLMKEKAGPIESLDGYLCETFTYYLKSLSQPVGKMWRSKRLGQVLKDVRYGGTKHAVLKLQNLKLRPQDKRIFKIPPGYLKVPFSEFKPAKAPPKSAGPKKKVNQDLEIILDASGSMLGKLGRRSKMEIAKKALLELTADLMGRDDLAVGIRVYGHQSHRKKKDCRDSKLEIPFARVNQTQIKALLKRIKPRGYTPLAYSLKKAASDFKAAKRGRSVILITDGLETCQGDPCAIARKLAASGMKITLHVVGFDLKKGEMQKLACLTKPSGGLLLEARNAGELRHALRKAAKRLGNRNLIVKATGSRGKPRQVHVEVFKAGTKKRLDIRQGPVAGFALATGGYDIVVRDSKTSQVVRLKEVKVRVGRVTTKEVSFASGRITLIIKTTSGEPLNKGYAEVIRTENGKELSHKGDYLIGKPKTFTLPAGTYTVKAQIDKMGHQLVLKNVQVGPGQQVVKELAFGRARLSVAAKDPKGKPLPAYIEVWRLENGRRSGYKSGGGPAGTLGLILVPGQYQIIAKRKDTGKKIKSQVFTLQDGSHLKKELVVP